MTTKPEVALQNLLNLGVIDRVIYVDDVFAFRGDADVEQAIGWFSQALRESQEDALALIPVTFPVPDEDTWRVEFRDKWERLGPNDKTNVINGLSGILNSQLGRDKEVAAQLRQLFPSGFDYREVPPSAWIDQKDQMLADIPAKSRVVCLFDQDLSAEPGFAAMGARSGGGLLKDLIDGISGYELLFCGVLSHTIPSIEAEYDYHGTFAGNFQIGDLDLKRFLPLTKTRLEEPIKFVDGIKKLLLHELGASIKRSALDVLDEAHQAAKSKIQSFDIYAFDRIVLGAARQANEWEFDTILRLFQIFQRNEVRLRLSDPATAESLNKLITATRPISQVQTVVEDYVYPRVWSIRREELYENGNLIRHRPLETGDIFEADQNTARSKFYILMAQPCDLAVRIDGTRTQDFVTLIPIVKTDDKYSNKKTRSSWRNYWSTRAVIGNFFQEAATLAVLEFKDAVAVKTVALDLAVMDSEGHCKIDTGNAIVPSHLTEGWQTLLKNQIQFYAKLDDHLRQIKPLLNDSKWDKEVRDKVWESTLPAFCFPAVLPKVSYVDGTFDFGLRRVERYRHPDADWSLKTYTQFLSREAKEFDFAS